MEARKRKLPQWMLADRSSDTTANTNPTAKTASSGGSSSNAIAAPTSNPITKYFSPAKKGPAQQNREFVVKMSNSEESMEEQRPVCYILSPAELEAVALEILAGGDD